MPSAEFAGHGIKNSPFSTVVKPACTISLTDYVGLFNPVPYTSVTLLSHHPLIHSIKHLFCCKWASIDHLFGINMTTS
jgi:hypothetical protein